ncbi:MAG: lipase family alpha/beta hydrolase [Marmoricola sp.]
MSARRLLVAVALVGSALIPSSATASGYAPLDRPGPPLSVPTATLAQALTCSSNLVSRQREAVLLVPGTTVTPAVEFSWSYERAFNQQKRPWCAIALPSSAMGDIQIAGEYVVYAIRTMHRLTGRKVQIVGHSQGGMVPRWALRFWPDTRLMVDDVIGMAPSNHGTVDAYALCLPVTGCAPAIWQQETNSHFYGALNSGAETFAGISYTNIYTVLDEVVVPNFNESGSSSLHTGAGQIANISVQSVCPGHITDHLLIGISDPVAFALVMDALNHVGPAQPARINRSVCGQLLQPGVDPTTFAVNFGKVGVYLATVLATSPHVPREPALASYTHD